jgi:predicted phosphodiesterase
VVFQHHPWFLADSSEPDQYFNVAREPRMRYLTLLRESGVRYVFAGHYHRNAVARDGNLEMVTTGPVGKPLGEGRSGIRIAVVTDTGIQHRFYEFSEIPAKVSVR